MSDTQDWGKLVASVLFGVAAMAIGHAIITRNGAGHPAVPTGPADDGGSTSYDHDDRFDPPSLVTPARSGNDPQPQPEPKPPRDRGQAERAEAEEIGKKISDLQASQAQALTDKKVGLDVHQSSSEAKKKQDDANAAIQELGMTSVATGLSLATGPLMNIAIATEEIGRSMYNNMDAQKKDPTKSGEKLQSQAIDLGLNEAGKIAGVAEKAVAGGMIGAVATGRAAWNAYVAQDEATTESDKLITTARNSGDVAMIEAVEKRERELSAEVERRSAMFRDAADNPEFASEQVLANGISGILATRRTEAETIDTLGKRGLEKAGQADKDVQELEEEVKKLTEQKELLEKAAAEKQQQAEDAEAEEARLAKEESERAAASQPETSAPPQASGIKSYFANVYNNMVKATVKEVDTSDQQETSQHGNSGSSEDSPYTEGVEYYMEIGRSSDLNRASDMTNEELDEHISSSKQQIEEMRVDGMTTPDDLRIFEDSVSNFEQVRSAR